MLLLFRTSLCYENPISDCSLRFFATSICRIYCVTVDEWRRNTSEARYPEQYESSIFQKRGLFNNDAMFDVHWPFAFLILSFSNGTHSEILTIASYGKKALLLKCFVRLLWLRTKPADVGTMNNVIDLVVKEGWSQRGSRLSHYIHRIYTSLRTITHSAHPADLPALPLCKVLMYIPLGPMLRDELTFASFLEISSWLGRHKLRRCPN